MCEAFWQVFPTYGSPQVEIVGLDGQLTCRLRRFPDGVWRGRWENHEMMPVELRRAAPSFQKGGTPRERIANTLDRFSRTTQQLFFVQIGSNDGKTGDPLNDLIKRDGWSGVLVEPIPYLFERLIKQYTGLPNLMFVNSAIADDARPRTMYRLENTENSFEPWHEQLASFHKDVVLSHASQLPGIEARIVEEEVACISLAQLFDRCCIHKLDLLHVDAEGHDFEILKQLDFERFQPELILFEHKHLAKEVQAECFRYLRGKAYDLVHDHDSGDTLAAHSPRKLRTVLIQHGTGEYAELLRLTHPIHSAYAERHGISFWAMQGDMPIERSPHWNKILLIQMALSSGFELVVWLDADTLIVRPEQDIRQAAPETGTIAMCEHPGEWRGHPSHFNSGVIVARNRPQAVTFFEKVWAAGPIRHGWQEQVRILECAAEMPELVCRIDDRWNSCEEKNPCENPVIKAWHGRGTRTLELMRNEVNLCRLRDLTTD